MIAEPWHMVGLAEWLPCDGPLTSLSSGARLQRRSTSAQRRNGHEPKLEDEVIRLRERAPSFEQAVGEAAALLQEADREPSGRLPPTRTAGTQTFTLSHRLHIAPG